MTGAAVHNRIAVLRVYGGAAWASHQVIPHIVACRLLPDAPGDE